MIVIKDFPKLESPFIRKVINDNYVVTPEVAKGFEWVFESPDVFCVEKLDGSNTSIVIDAGMIVSVWNRTARLPFFNKGKAHYIKGILEAYERGYCELPDGQHFGELIGEKINGNPLQIIRGNLWIPFNTYLKNHCAYESWHRYPKTFENIQEWFLKPISEGGIFSLLARKRDLEIKPEGVVFYHPDGRMAKLRLDMFSGWQGNRHRNNQEAQQ